MECVKQDINECLVENYMPYAVSVIASRALPNIDGFKPSHVKLLYTMYKMALLAKPRTKSANIVGQTMKLNPHGDGAIYETMVRMTKSNESLNTPFVDSKGNFGKVYSRDMAYAASRYTEAKLMPIANEIFKGIDKNIVNMIDNYDGTMKEPEMLPVTYPNILANCNLGIAVGMASNICSFNLSELCDYTISSINEEDCDLLSPDFPTGGLYLYNKSELRSINDTGRGSVVVQSKYNYDKDNNCIEITQIPYTTTVEAILDKIEDLVKQGKIKEISDVRDESDLGGLKLTIDIKRGVNPDVLMGKLFKLTPLQDSFSCNFNILVNGMPKVLGVKSIIQEWIKFRKQCINRELAFDISKLEEECNKLMGLEVILNDLDYAITLIRGSKSEQEAMDKLQSHFKLNQPQLDYICSIKLINMNSEWLKKRISKLGELTKEMSDMRSNIDSDHYYTQRIITELTEIKAKYGQPRRTQIIEETGCPQISKVDLIEDYNCQIVITEQGYAKKTLRFSESQKVKDGDFILQQMASNNRAKLLLFTDSANCYYLNCWELSATQPSNLGTFLPTQLQLKDEKIIHVVSTTDFKGYVLFGFENGKVAKISMAAYETKTNRTKMINAYNTESRLIGVVSIESDVEVLLKSNTDNILICNTDKIGIKTTKSSIGVNTLRLKPGIIMSEITLTDHIPDETKGCYIGNLGTIGKQNKHNL